MNVNAGDAFIFIVDTDTYAGSFERLLTAFCTGCIGECEVGKEYAAVFKKECPDKVKLFENIIESLPDDHGCLRPTTIWPTPGYWNDGMGSHWKDEEWQQPHTITQYREEIRKYKEQSPNFHLDPLTAVPDRHPAYQSVAMFFSEQPTQELLDFLIERARAYKPLCKFDGDFNIIGFRLIRQDTIEIPLWQAPS